MNYLYFIACHGMELVARAVQSFATRFLEMAQEVGIVVRRHACAVGDRYDLLAASAYRPGVPCAGSGIYSFLCTYSERWDDDE